MHVDFSPDIKILQDKKKIIFINKGAYSKDPGGIYILRKLYYCLQKIYQGKYIICHVSYINNKTSLSNGLLVSHDIFGFILNLRHKERYKKCQYCMTKSYDKEFNYIIRETRFLSSKRTMERNE